MNYRLIAYAQDFVSFLFEKLNRDGDKIKQIILFGSVARNESAKESDIDLFIEVLDKKLEGKIKELKEEFYKSIKTKKYWNLFGVNNEINCSIGKMEEWAELERSLIANGMVLYGKYKGKAETEPYYLFIVTPGKDRKKNISIWKNLYGYNQKIGKREYAKKGLIREYEGKKLARSTFIIPSEHTQKMISFLRESKFKCEIIQFWKEKE